MDQSAVVRLASQVENEYWAFLTELRKLEAHQYPTSSCLDFLKGLSREASKNLERVKEAAENALALPDGSDDISIEIDEIRASRVRLIQDLTVFLDWVTGAQTRKVPWSFVPSAERLANKIIPDLNTILYCENRYNYRIVWFKNPAEELQKYCFVSLPRLHRINVLMHTLVGHELFHPRCKDFTDKHRNKVATDAAKECKETFPDLNPNTLFGQQQLSRKTAEIMFAWERALHELLCDMFCAELFGPAALLAMRAYASFSEWFRKPAPDNTYYPHWQYRFETVWQRAISKPALEGLWEKMSQHGEIQEFLHCFKNELSVFKDKAALESTKGYDFVQNLPEDESSKLLKIAYAEISKLLGAAHKYVESCLPGGLAKWSDCDVLKQVPRLVSRLEAGIPPNEIPNIVYGEDNSEGEYKGEPAELPAILLAGWIYQVFREGRGKEDKVLPYETLSRFILKGCEDSEMLRSR